MDIRAKKYTVCRWISEVYKGPLDPSVFVNMKLTKEYMKNFDDLGFVDPKEENIHPACVGTIVDLCTRVILCDGMYWNPMHTIEDGYYMIEAELEQERIWQHEVVKKAMGIKYERDVYERCILEDRDKIEDLRSEIIANRGKLTREIVILITLLIRYNNYYRAGYYAFKEEATYPSEKTIEHILKMANRSAEFLKTFGEVNCGLYFNQGGFKNTKHVKKGDGDFWTDDVFFDMKVKKDPLVRSDDLKQQIIYYLLSKNDRYNFKKCVMFNPRYGSYFEFDVKDIPVELVKDILSKW